ncbi:hypothetical protein [Plastoroseomonas hellenica]|uniref:hypothetical protein n=1 Tax=Plastoroseomonas hellenica TaxID=2687306 RepID=UPI001BA87C85|nr:hypothetical protein [Plastoroseomonas hellenica]MBR0645155.1 hypothetical protein [Plastoroseomonas hellenica]
MPQSPETLNDPGHLTFLERGLYIIGGLLLAAAGAKPRPNPLLNIAALSVGGYLAWRGAEGSCPAKAAIAELDSAPTARRLS